MGGNVKGSLSMKGERQSSEGPCNRSTKGGTRDPDSPGGPEVC